MLLANIMKERKEMNQSQNQNQDLIQDQNHQDLNIHIENIGHQDIETKVKVKERLKNVII